MMTQLSDEEIEKLRSLVPLAEQIKEEAEYRIAQRLVLKTWRKGIIFISTFIAGVYVLREQIAAFFGGKL